MDFSNQHLSEVNLFDFDDMILFVLRAFKQYPDLKLKYQELFQYFLVDEYQDTNGSQNELLFALCDYYQSPNLFVVGVMIRQFIGSRGQVSRICLCF